MGALFLIAGYFTPGSFDRKGPGSFLKDRLLRLGIPLLIWIFVISPISSIGFWQMPAAMTGITDPLSWQAYPFLLGLGVAWFLALLLIFSLGYAAYREPTKNETTAVVESSPPGYLATGIFILGLALGMLACTEDELVEFMKESAVHADGWISFYWGTPAEELLAKDNATIGESITAHCSHSE